MSSIIDLHCDTILKLLHSEGKGDLAANSLSVDIDKLQKAGSIAQFFALYIDLEDPINPLERCLAATDFFYQQLAAHSDRIALATNSVDLTANQAAGKISAFLTIEEGGAIKGSLANLRNFHRLGVRLMTLTWNFANEIGFPNYRYQTQDKGLTPFGQEVVTEMNRLGMIIDVSHLSDQGFYDVARLSTKPFVASHSNARIIKDHSRNLTDDMIHTLAKQGGVMGLNFAKEFLGDNPMSRVEDMIRHLRHIYNIGGIEVMALGTDFDGISPGLEIADIGEIDKLLTALSKAGFSDDEIDKISWKNTLRVIRDTLG